MFVFICFVLGFVGFMVNESWFGFGRVLVFCFSVVFRGFCGFDGFGGCDMVDVFTRFLDLVADCVVVWVCFELGF